MCNLIVYNYLLFIHFFTVCVWSEGESRLLLDLYSPYFPEIGPSKKFKTRKHMFNKIAEEINSKLSAHYTGQRCDTRFKTLKKRKTKVVDSNGKSGSSRQLVEFEEEFNLIRATDDSVKPDVIMGVTQAIYKQTMTPGIPTDPQPSTSVLPSTCTFEKTSPPRESSERMRHMRYFFQRWRSFNRKRTQHVPVRRQGRKKEEPSIRSGEKNGNRGGRSGQGNDRSGKANCWERLRMFSQL